MARFRKIDSRIWNDEKFRDLSDQGKFVFLFLLTHPHMTALGAMRANQAGLAQELGWDPKGFREGFAELFRKGFLEHDERACFLALPNFLKYNLPENPNVVKSWEKSLDLIPECNLKVALIARVKRVLDTLPEVFREPFRKGMPNPEPEPEPLKEPEPEREGESSSSGTRVANASEKPTLPPALSNPPGFEITEKLKAWAAENVPSIDLEAEFRKFQVYCRANGKRYPDWEAGFQNWLIKAPGFNRSADNRSPPGESRDEHNRRVIAEAWKMLEQGRSP